MSVLFCLQGVVKRDIAIRGCHAFEETGTAASFRRRSVQCSTKAHERHDAPSLRLTTRALSGQVLFTFDLGDTIPLNNNYFFINHR